MVVWGRFCLMERVRDREQERERERKGEMKAATGRAEFCPHLRKTERKGEKNR